MARRTLTQQDYDDMITAFREKPGNTAHVSRITKVVPRTALKAWMTGWPEKGWIPIKDVIEHDKTKMRANRMREEEIARKRDAETREQARMDAINVLNEEGRAAGISRRNAIAVGAMIGRILIACNKLAENIQSKMEDPAWMAQTTPRETLVMFRHAAFIVRAGGEAVRTALEIERLRVGDPKEVLASLPGMQGVTPEEAVQELIRVQESIKRAEALGLVVLKGGDDAQDDRDDGDEEPSE